MEVCRAWLQLSQRFPLVVIYLKLYFMDERKTNLMHLLYIFIVAAASTRFAPPPPAQRPQHTAHNTYATDLVF
jgi:hypothetical protein